MDVLIVEGGRRLNGEIQVSGSKNAALPILAATLLTDEPCVITNVPQLVDIETMIALLVFLGKDVVKQGDTLTVTAGPTLYAEAPYELVRRMRGSVVVMGPLLARLGRVKVSLPGGCAIGGRPINIHLDGFRAMGGTLEIDGGFVKVETSHLQGASIRLDFPSVGATENLMMAAVLADGRTTIFNAAKEPEITDLARCLNAMGAHVTGAGTDTVEINGVAKLRGTEHEVIPDRIEAGTFLSAVATTGGNLTVSRLVPEHVASLTAKLRQAGVKISESSSSITVEASHKVKPIDIETEVYPGFPTDLQAQWMALMTLSTGVSRITEQVFENRFMHVAELQRMGARITVKDRAAIIEGVAGLSGAPVMVSDLRAGAALVLAALAAKGRSVIHRVYHLDRGYEKLESKLSSVGASIERGNE